jgi:hypothetical protein
VRVRACLILMKTRHPRTAPSARGSRFRSKCSLPRTLRLRDLLLLVTGAIIGSGIVLVPGAILNKVDQSVVAAGLVWVVGGVLSLLGRAGAEPVSRH